MFVFLRPCPALMAEEPLFFVSDLLCERVAFFFRSDKLEHWSKLFTPVQAPETTSWAQISFRAGGDLFFLFLFPFFLVFSFFCCNISQRIS